MLITSLYTTGSCCGVGHGAPGGSTSAQCGARRAPSAGRATPDAAAPLLSICLMSSVVWCGSKLMRDDMKYKLLQPRALNGGVLCPAGLLKRRKLLLTAVPTAASDTAAEKSTAVSSFFSSPQPAHLL